MTSWFTQLMNGWGSIFDVYLHTIIEQVNRVIEIGEKVAEKFNRAIALLETLTDQGEQIIQLLTPPSPVAAGLAVTITALNLKGELMGAAKKAAVDVQILDSGKVKYTFSAVDAAGQTTTFPPNTPPLSNIVVSDPNLVVAPDATDATGMTLIGTPTLQPGAVLPIVGIVVSAQTTFPGAATPVTGTAAPVDIVAGAAAGLAVAELSE